MSSFGITVLALTPPAWAGQIPHHSLASLTLADEDLITGSISMSHEYDHSSDYVLRWTERRHVPVFSENLTLERSTIQIARVAYAKVHFSAKLLFAVNARKQYSRLLNLIWSNSADRPSYCEVSFNIKKALQSHAFRSRYVKEIVRVVIDHLPVETLPNTTLVARSVSAKDVLQLVLQTPARISELVAIPFHEDISRLVIRDRGSIRLHVAHGDWSTALRLTEELVDILTTGSD